MAWSFFVSMMFGSSWGQIDETLRGEVEPYNTGIIASKVAILAIAVVALALSVRNAATSTKSPSNRMWFAQYICYRTVWDRGTDGYNSGFLA
jgi:hypothetical protein